MENINGQMGVHILDNCLMAKDMEKVIIIVLKINLNIMESFNMVLNMDMECLNLINNPIIKEISIKGIDMEKVK